ncbi:ABC transporter ATP-binding protein [Spiroplasma culicicola]|uniref:ABC transporter ATP-binding protein/permease n=1 Tax=Spiroplasma culicicola AES-1 TaxID=1276246 RepID=W6A7X1_9MOLU|nr:ABC transporter ATP-binding protein [Spiroplasma culicicola]AHI53092.1 ABC transporter ATP-binding protein/permease [Spiroplasma culicicola AES-1]
MLPEYQGGNNPFYDANIKEPKLKNKKVYDANERIYFLIKKRQKLKFLWIVLVYGKKYKALFITLLTAIIITSFCMTINSLLINITLKQAIFDYSNDLTQGHDYGLVWWKWMLITFSSMLILYFTTYLRNALSIKMAVRVEVELRNLTIKRLLEQDISYYSDKKIGKLMTKLVGDTNVIGNEISGLIAWVIQAPFIIVFGSIMLLLIDLKLAAVSISLVYLFAIVIIAFSMTYQKKVVVVRDVISDINGDVIDRIGAIKLVKSSATRTYEESRLEEIHKPYLKAFKPISHIDGHLLALLISSDVFINLAVIGASVLFYGNNTTEFLSKIIPITTATLTLTRPLWQIAGIIPGLSRASASSQKIYEVVYKDPILDDNENSGVLFDENIAKIEFRDVSFNYPEKPEVNIVPNLNLKLEKGKSYAFVGATGSGKSTISKLLLRFYDPTRGAVLINDKNLKDFNLRSFLAHVGYVEQDPQIIFGDVYDNVKYGHFQATDEEVHEACRKAQIDNIINSWPQGYKTVLGERGLLLSGGQKQRLVIARILLKNPELIVLDEATSALDNIVEKEIQAQLNALMEDKTSVIIAHRLSTIKNVDQIFVLSPGEGIVQSGTYEQLIKIPGHFKDLHDAAN